MPFMAIAFAFGLCTILLAELHQLGRRRLRTLHRQATQDPLTQCLNHGAVHTFGALAHARSRRRTEDLGVLMIDIDRFKGVNDRYGHMTGDALIVDLARRLQRAVRAEDAVGRCGGDEFLVVMPGVDRDGLQALAARIEDVLHPRVLVKGEPVGATVSVGAACLSGVGADSSWRDLVIAADAALYASKGAGRGRWSLPPVPQHPADALLGAAT
jgi:diguanylate cyclase (GGDEF)-like protein